MEKWELDVGCCRIGKATIEIQDLATNPRQMLGKWTQHVPRGSRLENMTGHKGDKVTKGKYWKIWRNKEDITTFSREEKILGQSKPGKVLSNIYFTRETKILGKSKLSEVGWYLIDNMVDYAYT